MSVSVSAPGKLILAGEYAVLDGATAIVAAVARRAVATVAPPDPARDPGPFLAAAAAVLDAAGEADAAALVRARVVVDSAALRDDGGVKLGLGSSAAATVAAVGCALVAAGRPLDRGRVYQLARDAHRHAQAARGVAGSGADVAAAALGGVLAFRDGATAAVTLPACTWMALWTGRPADTVDLVAAVMTARQTRPGEVGAALGAIAAAASALAAAREPAAAIAAIAAGGAAIAALGAAAGLDLETAPVRAARRVAARHGGAVKTCGAGGGDVAVAALPPDVDRIEITARFVEAGCRPLDLPFDPRGVDIDPGGDYLP